MDAQQVGDEAQRFVQGLVDAFGVSGTTTVRRDGDDIEVVVEGSDLGLLVGPRGATLQSVQELTRVASQRRLGDHDTRLRSTSPATASVVGRRSDDSPCRWQSK